MRFKNSAGKLFCLITVIIVLASLTGCRRGEPEPSGPIVFELDSAVLYADAKGLNLEVTDFKWRYIENTDQIRLTGSVINKSGKPLQSIRIFVAAFDQFNYPLGESETYISPTYIPPDSEGRFDCYYHRGRWVTAIHLKYHFETRY